MPGITLPENSRPIWLPPLLWLIRSLLSLPYASMTSRKFRDPAESTADLMTCMQDSTCLAWCDYHPS